MKKSFQFIGTTSQGGNRHPVQEWEKKALDAGLSIDHGRIGEPLEYYEFDPHLRSRVKWVCQRSGSYWNVFVVYPGPKGAVRTLFTNGKLTKARDVAIESAINKWSR